MRNVHLDAHTRGTSTFAGEHSTTDGATCRPLPLQDGGIPLWIAAQHAAYTNFDGTLEGFTHTSQVLAGHCADLGTDYGAITRSANDNTYIGRDEAEVRERIAAHRARMEPLVSPDAVEREMGGLEQSALGVGTPEQIIEQLRPVVAAGMTYPIVYFPEAAHDTSGIELFEREVVPALRG